MVSAIESGRRSFSGDLTVIGYSPERFEIAEMSTPLHRYKASTTVASKARAQELLRCAGEVFGELRRFTGRMPPMTLERLPSPQSFEDIEDLAGEARVLLGQEEHGQIRNLTSTIERAGVCLIPIRTATGEALPGVDGLSSWVAGDIPVVGASPLVPGDRFRFTLAHELAHLLIHVRRTENTELEASRFAGALLFPREDFDEAMPKSPQLRDFVALKSSWGVAVSSLVMRAHELDYIDDRRDRALQIQMSKWRKSEPAPFDPVHGALLPRLVEVNGGVDEVGRKFGFNREHLAELTNWSHLRVA
jgi:Zn-dependent peptidase ImmA (M78 family)